MVRTMLACLALVALCSCAGAHYSVTPYISAGRSQGEGNDFRGGLSVTFYDQMPGTPAVPSSYYSKTEVNVDGVSSAEASSEGGHHHGHHKDD